MNSTTACTPNSGWCTIRLYAPVICSELDYCSDNFLKLACRSLYISEIGLPVLVFLSAPIRIFFQCPGLICVKWFLLILPRSLFTPSGVARGGQGANAPLAETLPPSCHLPFGCQNPSSWKKWVFLRSSVWQNITTSNYFPEFALVFFFFFFALYLFFLYPTLIL